MNTNAVCIRCGKDKPLSKYKLSGDGIHRRKQCNSCVSRWQIAKFKLDMLKAFDFKCSCCGERQPYFLTLDHRNNDGAEHRKRKAQVSVLLEARREGFDKSRWDCLCMNCNFAKGHYGVCPHQAGKSAEDVVKELQESCRKIGRKHVDPKTNGSQQGFMKSGFDPRRMQLNRRVLKPCPYCGLEFGTNEMARHKRSTHAEEIEKKRVECLARGRAL